MQQMKQNLISSPQNKLEPSDSMCETCIGFMEQSLDILIQILANGKKERERKRKKERKRERKRERIFSNF